MPDPSDPIAISLFADAIRELPLSVIYAKVSEIRNSIVHLHRSNDEMKAFIAESCEAEEDKRELEGYISENEGVHASMLEKLALLKIEVEGRGQSWIEVSNGTHANESNDSAQSSQSAVNGTTQTSGESSGQNETEQEGIYL